MSACRLRACGVGELPKRPESCTNNKVSAQPVLLARKPQKFRIHKTVALETALPEDDLSYSDSDSDSDCELVGLGLLEEGDDFAVAGGDDEIFEESTANDDNKSSKLIRGKLIGAAVKH